ncbi:FecR family protein [Pseudomonas cremoricolorata]|uniref:Peptide ABC transporter substrate-binding protein n=1 Tax=Pseudomonas cremoricolorata TaxID=157783 RepID=A0A089WJD9_9PSED|nr:FecR domain-containing protein [Pseudomonas cremoricolorata]AIR89435.1 peptide ABC transporter substrate-binding protein [Pseudomonas cremoricolorata]
MQPMPALQPEVDADGDVHQHATQWFIRLQQPNCDRRLREAFAQWYAEPRNAEAYAAVQARWLRSAVPPERPRPNPVQLRRSKAGAYLGVLFLLLLAALAYLYWPWAQRQTSDLHSAPGERRIVKLNEGSSVQLNGASALNLDLRGRVRQLHLLQGQMYLEVRLDGRAMEVQVDDARIQVFGTRLLIGRRADGGELVVLDGKAMVTQGGDQRLVSAGERVSFGAHGIATVQKADIQAAQAWRKGELIAQDMPLGELLQRLTSPQGQRVWLLDEQTAHRRISGHFDLDHAEQTLQRLAAEQQVALHDLFGHGWLLR